MTDLPDAGGPQVLTGAVDGRSVPLIAGAESVTIAADDLAGYAALPCGVPRLESWLVGGSIDTGTEDIVTLTNAADVPSTVTLSVYGPARSTRTVIVPARSQAALPLTSFATGNDVPVVKVSAVGRTGASRPPVLARARSRSRRHRPPGLGGGAAAEARLHGSAGLRGQRR